MAELDVRKTEVLGNSAKFIQCKIFHILLRNNFLLCTILPLIFRPYGEVFHVHVFVGLLVLNVYGFLVHLLFVGIVSFFHVKNIVKSLCTFFSYLFSPFSEQQNLLLNMCCL